ncbi:MAG: helix-turn-helix domain-containing protein, partial [Acetobacteraceae bacterium]
LPALAAAGRFRADLLDRLAFDVIAIPPLREREGDVRLLAEHFAARMAAELGRPYFAGFAPQALAVLESHPWPGNVRELRNVVERSLARDETPERPLRTIRLDPFPARAAPAGAPPASTPTASTSQSSAATPGSGDFSAAVAAFEADLLRQALAATRYNRRAAALRLGLDADYAMAAALKGVGGAATATVSAPVALSLGGVTLGRRRLLFGLAESAFGPPARWRHGVPDGLLGLDVLSRFRVDLDIARLRLSLYRRHPCSGALPSWCRPCLAVPRLPASDPLLHVAVALNGGRLDGVLDTGAMISVTTAAALRRAAITGLALGRDPTIIGLGATGVRGSGRLHRFRRLALGPGLPLNPYVVVLHTSLPTADILVGLNALSRSRIWIAPGATTLAFAPPPARVAGR